MDGPCSFKGRFYGAFHGLPITVKIMASGMIVLVVAACLGLLGVSLMRDKPAAGFTLREVCATVGFAGLSAFAAIVLVMFMGGFPLETRRNVEGGARHFGMLPLAKILLIGIIPLAIFVGGMDWYGSYLVALYHPQHGFSLHVILWTLGLGALTAALAAALTSLITRPLRELARVAQAIGKGEMSIRAQVYTHDEAGRLARVLNEMAENLQQKEVVRLQLVGKIIAAQERERALIARELHDRTGQSLTSLVLGLKNLESQCESCLVGRMNIESLKSVVTEAIDRVHEMAIALHPGVLDEIGLFPALRQQIECFQKRCDLVLDFQTIGFAEGERIARESEATLYRIILEAIMNALRHAEAHSISVVIQRLEREIVAIVEDDGKGFDAKHWRQHDPSGGHLGLYTMEERAALLGGTLKIESGGDHQGTALFVRFPIGVGTVPTLQGQTDPFEPVIA